MVTRGVGARIETEGQFLKGDGRVSSTLFFLFVPFSSHQVINQTINADRQVKALNPGWLGTG
jgi:hypothetical protein